MLANSHSLNDCAYLSVIAGQDSWDWIPNEPKIVDGIGRQAHAATGRMDWTNQERS